MSESYQATLTSPPSFTARSQARCRHSPPRLEASQRATSPSSSPIHRTISSVRKGVTWGVVGQNVTENNTVENIGQLFAASQETRRASVHQPALLLPARSQVAVRGGVGAADARHQDVRPSEALDLTNFDGSGADWLEQYKPFINDGETVVTSPHKVYGPESNDLVLQLRKRGIDQVILAGMSANLCVESHLRELLEQGFEVAVVGDATAAAQIPGYDGYEAAITNFRFLASDLWSTSEATERLSALK